MKTQLLKIALLVGCLFAASFAKAATAQLTVTGINTPGTNNVSSGTIQFNTPGVVLYGFTVTNSGAASNMSAVSFSTNGVISDFFTTYKIYRSNSTDYNTGPLTQITTATIAAAGSQVNVTFAPGTPETFTLNQARNYFIVASYTNAGQNLPSTFGFTSYHDMTVSTGNKGSSGSTLGQTLTLAAPYLTISNYSTGVYTGTTVTNGTAYPILGFTLTPTGPVNLHELTIDLTYPSGGDKFNSGYITSVQLIDASTNAVASGITQTNVNADNITFEFSLNTISAATNYYVKVTFGSFSAHKPTAFNMCINSVSNVQGNVCGNKSNCQLINNYINGSSGTSCSQTIVGVSTLDWNGSSSNVWSLAANWSPNVVPGSNDIARIGVGTSYKFNPSVQTTTSVGSIEMGALKGTSTTKDKTLTVTGGQTLTVNGDITQDNGANITTKARSSIIGGGTVTCQNLNIGDVSTTVANSGTLSQDSTVVSSLIGTFNVLGNINMIANLSANGNVGYFPVFNLDANNVNLTGSIVTSNNVAPSTAYVNAFWNSRFNANNSNNNNTLTLYNVTPIASPIANNHTIDFNNGGSGSATVIYAATGSNQKIYTSADAVYFGTQNGNYNNLTLTGGSKISDGGALTISNDFTSSATTNLNTNDPTITIGDNWVNSGDVTQGDGDITVTNLLQNNSNTITGGNGDITVGISGIQINFGSIVGGAGTITCNGQYQNNSGTLACGGGSVIFTAGYQNSGTFTAGTGTVFFTGTAAQSLIDNSTAGTTFNNVSFTGTSTTNAKTMSGSKGFAVSDIGVLKMVGATTKLDAGGVLTLNSDINGTAAVDVISSGSSVVGLVNVQRYLSGGTTKDGTGRWTYRNYRLMSSPVSQTSPASTAGYNNANAGSAGSILTYPISLKYLATYGIVTGAIGGYNKPAGTFNSATAVGNPTIYLYREDITPNNNTFTGGNFIGVNNVNSATQVGTTDPTITSGNIPVGNGYMFYFRGARGSVTTEVANAASATSSPYIAVAPGTFTSTGYLNQGTYVIQNWVPGANLKYENSPTYNGVAQNNTGVRGYNLVGNPYASSIDWEKLNFSTATTGTGIVANSASNVSATIWVFNPVTNQYNTYIKGNAGIGTGVDLTTHTGNTKANIIASGQGFFVKALANSSKLTFYETAKVASTQAALPATGLSMLNASAPQSTPAYMRLALVTDSINNDDVLFFFKSSASSKFSEQEDAVKLPGFAAPESLASMSSDNVKLAINTVNLPKSQVIPLSVNVTNSGLYTFQRMDLESVPDIYEIWLMDKFKKDSLDIKHNKTYAFTADKSDTTTYGSTRFSIVIRQNSALGFHLLDFTASKSTDGASTQWRTDNEYDYTNFTVERSIDGGKTWDGLYTITSNGQNTYNFTDTNPVAGVDAYRLKITDLNGDITYSKVIQLNYKTVGATISSNLITVYPNPATELINVTIKQDNVSYNYNIRLTNSTGTLLKSVDVAANTWQNNISGLVPGTYIIQVVDNKTKALVGTSKFIKQ